METTFTADDHHVNRGHGKNKPRFRRRPKNAFRQAALKSEKWGGQFKLSPLIYLHTVFPVFCSFYFTIFASPLREAVFSSVLEALSGFELTIFPEHLSKAVFFTIFHADSGLQSTVCVEHLEKTFLFTVLIIYSGSHQAVFAKRHRTTRERNLRIDSIRDTISRNESISSNSKGLMNLRGFFLITRSQHQKGEKGDQELHDGSPNSVICPSFSYPF